MVAAPDASVIADAVSDRTVAGVVDGIGSLIRHGTFAPGDRLPTVRLVAAELGIGLATVSEAWGRLAEAGMIETRGRAGSFVPVVQRRTAARFFRYSRRGDFRLDLSNGLSDPALVPPVSAFLDRVDSLPHPSTYIADPTVPALEERVRSSLPFTPEVLTVVDGALDALDRLLGLWVRLGDRVAVADPGFPPTFDLIEEHGGLPVPVDIDGEGMEPDSLARALRERPVAVIIQPRAQNPTGGSLTQRRVSELAEVLGTHPEVWVVEDDHSGGVASTDLFSLATTGLPRVVHVTSFSKSHGPDLRIGTVAGPAVPLQALIDRRRLGPAWTSRFLQTLLAEMLIDDGCRQVVLAAGTAYADRRSKLVAALAERGVEVGGGDGLNVWVPVPDEQAALMALASRGIAVAPGRPFQLRPTFEGHIRITTGATAADLTEVAELLAG